MFLLWVHLIEFLSEFVKRKNQKRERYLQRGRIVLCAYREEPRFNEWKKVSWASILCVEDSVAWREEIVDSSSRYK